MARRAPTTRFSRASLSAWAPRKARAARGLPAPDFDEFWRMGEITLPQAPDDGGMLRAFREDPAAHPLPTRSGKIEIFSEAIAGFGYADCPGHPAWLAPIDAPDTGRPLRLVANQPATRLHSQFDFGGHSGAIKQRGREVMRMHPADGARPGPRHRPRRHRAALQRARCLPRRGHGHRGYPRRRGAAADRRLVRPRGS